VVTRGFVLVEQRESDVGGENDFRVAGQLLSAGRVRKQPTLFARTGNRLRGSLSAGPQGRGNAISHVQVALASLDLVIAA